MNKLELLKKYSDYDKVKENAKKYLGNSNILISTRKNKKFMVEDPINKKYIHFGAVGYEDFTHSKNLIKKNKYLARSEKIKGNWEKNKYSPNNLSRNILWS